MFVVKSRARASALSSSAKSAVRAVALFRQHKNMGLVDTVCFRDHPNAMVVVPYRDLVRLAADEGWIG